MTLSLPIPAEWPVWGKLRVCAVLAAAALVGRADPTITLQDAAARKPPEYTLLYDGRTVVVSGQVSAKPVRMGGDVVHLAIQERGHGLVLEGAARVFSQLSPGDWVEAHGRISQRAGLPVVVVAKIATVSSGAPPLPVPLTTAAIQNMDRLGQLVKTEGQVIELGSNFGGAFLRIGAYPDTLKVFLPSSPDSRRAFAGFAVGDTVRVTGIAYQYCPIPPHTEQFELLIGEPSDIVRLSGNWQALARSFWPLLAALAIMALFWWRREITSRNQREMLRTIYHLGEEILSAASSPEILSKIALVLPRVLKVTGAKLYLYDRGANTLQPAGEPQSTAFGIESPLGLVQSSVVACYRNRTILSIPDARRHPFSSPGRDGPASPPPRSLLFVPMLAQGEPVGVFQVDNDRRARSFSSDEQAVAQHLANQIGLAVKLLQQRSFREQLSRSEKLAAVGRLISGVVNDLQTPLEAISSMADSAIEQHTGSASPNHELLVIASEARRATAIVTRLVSFAQPEQAPAEPVELNQLLLDLIQFREREWKACGIQLSNLIKNKKPVHVLGSRGQLEQVFLNLLVHAEQALEDAPEKRITVRADVLAKRVFIEIGYSAALQGAAGAEGSQPAKASASGEVSDLGLDVCRSIVAGHGGEMRITTSGQQSILEVELPSLPPDQRAPEAPPAEPVRSTRRWTALMLEQEEFVERRLVEWLSNRGYRVVPVRSSEEGLDLVQRLRFDVVFCSTRLTGLNWVEFFDRVRGRVGAFALLAEAFSQDLSTHFRGEGRYVLHKPIDQSQFDRTLAAIEGRLQRVETGTPEVESY
jgi:GAF domain-containing protein/CheY-like chemotaxis protein